MGLIVCSKCPGLKSGSAVSKTVTSVYGAQAPLAELTPPERNIKPLVMNLTTKGCCLHQIHYKIISI